MTWAKALIRLSLAFAALSWAHTLGAAEAYLNEDFLVEAADGRSLEYEIIRPATSRGIPLVIVVDGSGCLGHKRAGFSQLLSPAEYEDHAFARLVVGKYGVPATKASNGECSEEFMRHYAMDDRVLDHLRVLQVVGRGSDWWNGELLLFGWSDGGDIAAQLFAYNPTISKLAFGGTGGGLTMAEHFERFWACPEDEVDDRDVCLASLRQQFAEIDTNPTWTKHWAGADNSYKAWESRLSTRLTPLLKGEQRPVLMVHGAQDIDGAPVESARVLARKICDPECGQFEYWEIDGMEHGIWSLPASDAMDLEGRVLNWLLKPVPSNKDSTRPDVAG